MGNDSVQRVLVTGATGFAGRPLCNELLRQSYRVRAAVRSADRSSLLPAATETVVLGELGPHTDWTGALDGVDVVIHLAARVHVFKERTADPLAAFRTVNVEATQALASAAAGRVRRLVFVSSLHAMCRLSDEPLTETTPCRPDSPYGQSKLEAEEAVLEVADRTGLQVCVLRPPPVYGPGNQGNLQRLFRLVQAGWPLPLGSLTKLRSLLFVQNLVDALVLCARHPAASDQTFLLSDGEDVSAADLVQRLARALHVRAPLWRVPLSALRLTGRLLGRSDCVERLLGSLAVGATKIRQSLGWTPPYSLDQGLQITADWLRGHELPHRLERAA